MASNASVTTSTSNLSRDERAKIIQEKRSAASASLPKTPPREVIGNLSSATNDVTSPYDDRDKFSEDGITPLATIVEEAATNTSAKHGNDHDDDDEDEDDAADDDDDHEDKDNDAADDDDHEDKDDAADGYDDADYHDDGGEEDNIIFEVRKQTADTLPLRPGEWQGYKEDKDKEDEYADDDDNGGGKCPPPSRLSSELYYPEDANDELLDDIFNGDYQEKRYSSIPNNKDVETWRYRVQGGPQLQKMPRVPRKIFTAKNERLSLITLDASCIGSRARSQPSYLHQRMTATKSTRAIKAREFI